MKNKVLYAIVSLLVLTGCGSMKNMSREDRAGVGAQIGAFVGWLFGGAVGNAIDEDIGGDIGAFVGTAVGGIAGAQIAANKGDVVRVTSRFTIASSFFSNPCLISFSQLPSSTK